MPEPGRWDESLKMMTSMYNGEVMNRETFEKIKCPVLLMNGDNDGYSSIDEFIQIAKYVPNAQVSLIPGCHHVIFFCNFPAVWAAMEPFLK
jgi:pimeloyl-ACP methyl ester carboxylesterase